MPLISVQESLCKKCYTCIRICPVQAIKVETDKDVPQILHNRCIGCGHCVTICHPKAIIYHNSTQETKNLLSSGVKVAAIVAPSISGEFSDITDYRKFVEMIRRLGFTYVCEVSFGVDLVAQKYAELFNNNKGKNYLSANCPAVFSYIEKFQPELVENIAPIVSPMIATAKVVHKQYGTDTKITYIGPCIATKKEARRYRNSDGHVDTVLTFHELRQLFAENGIKESTVEYSEFDPPFGHMGSLYPISNGLLHAAGISENLMSGNVITADGRDDMLEAIRQFKNRPEVINRHFNLFYDEGCIMGPGTSSGGEQFLRRTLVVNYSNKRLKTFNKREWSGNMKKFLAMDLTTSFRKDDQRLEMPSEERIEDIMNQLGKDEASDNPGCGSCGYESCRHFATNVAKGLTKIEMCISYSQRNLRNHIETLKTTNEELAKTELALQESEAIARRESKSAQEAMETFETMLQKLPSSIIIVDEHLKIIQANQSMIRVLGPEAGEISEIIPGLVGADMKTLLPFQVYNMVSFVLQNGEDIQNRDIHLNDILYNISVFTIRKNKIAGAVIRDMYAPAIRKEEVIKRVTDVIDKHLEMVQKIGFLLGEGAAETEQMLNSIIEFYKKEKNQK